MRFTDQTLNLEELAVPEFQTAWQGVFKNRSEGQFHPNSLFDHCSCTLYAPISNFTCRKQKTSYGSAQRQLSFLRRGEKHTCPRLVPVICSILKSVINVDYHYCNKKTKCLEFDFVITFNTFTITQTPGSFYKERLVTSLET